MTGAEELEGPGGVHGGAVAGRPDHGSSAGEDDGGDEGRRSGRWLNGDEPEGEGAAGRRPRLVGRRS